MTRKPRPHYIVDLYHVTVRGNGGQNIFADYDDRYRFFLFLQEGVEKYWHRIHAFCLMNNHVHLAIQVVEKPLSRIMQNLRFRYTQWANSKQKKVGLDYRQFLQQMVSVNMTFFEKSSEKTVRAYTDL